MPRKPKQVIQHKEVWKPLDLYSHQSDVIKAYRKQYLRYFLAWHRRAGKDVFALDFARERAYERVGTYWHLFPFHVQARRAIWKGIDARTGERFIDRAFPRQIRKDVSDSEMSITLDNGSVWQMLGSDNYDRHIGANPCGLIFSEWALCDPAAWEYLRPILLENKGWAMFITTFRGTNHAFRMYESVRENSDWYCDLRTIDHTHRHDGSPIITAEDVEKEIAEGMDAALARQEFYCDPQAATSGAIFSRQHSRLATMSLSSEDYNHSRVIRIAWGEHEEGIAAVAFQDKNIIAVHKFCEQNYADAVLSVQRRHPNSGLIHYARDPDLNLFSSLDGAGVVAASLDSNMHHQHGHAEAALNACSVTRLAREALIDFTMSYAPFRATNDETDLTHDALCEALAVMNTALPSVRPAARAPLDYTRYDRGII